MYARGGVCKRGYNDQGNLWLPGASTGSVNGEEWLSERGGRFDGLSDRSGHFDRLSDRSFVCGILFLSPRLFFGCQDRISVDVLTLVVTDLVEPQ